VKSDTIDNYEQRLQPRSAQEKTFDNGFKLITQISALTICLLIMWIIIQVLIQALPAIKEFG